MFWPRWGNSLEPEYLRLMSVKETMQFLCMGRTKLYETINAGDLKTVKRGRRRLIVAADAAAYVERLREQSSVISA
jgi:Helix-turn-helix domain